MPIPTSVPIFPTLVDNVDDVLADHQNNPNDEIEALATMVGVLGVSQSKSHDILEFLRGISDDRKINSMKLSYVSATTVRVSAGTILCSNSGATQRVLRKNTSTTDVTFADIDTGAEAASTKYYVWAIADSVGTTVSFKISTSSSAPTGATLFSLVGYFYNDASSNIQQNSVSATSSWRMVQRVMTTSNTFATTTSAIPQDNSIPQSGEGMAVITGARIVPQKTTNILVIKFETYGDTASNVNFVCGALFKDPNIDGTYDSDAIYAKGLGSGFSGGSPGWSGGGEFQMSAGQVSPIDFMLRIGGNIGATVAVNGYTTASAARAYGDIPGTYLVIEEYEQSNV